MTAHTQGTVSHTDKICDAGDLLFLLSLTITLMHSKTFTVSQLNQRAKQLLEISFSSVRVEGEISNISRPSSGHWYFSLKDRSAQVRCAMFCSRTAQLKFLPKAGDQVEIRAKVSLYEARGDYQLIVDGMKPAGEGALLLAFEALKTRLHQQGLFNPDRKQPLPAVKRIGVITSASGAALHDMLTVLARRAPDIEVDIYPTLVQGNEAASQIMQAIQRANRDARVDVLIVGRGGGSLEDLWCFNDEHLAHAIANSALPVVSAVGHEVDTTIADFVADIRAPTPSAAAELVSPNREQQLRHIVTTHQALAHRMSHILKQQSARLAHASQRLKDPASGIQQRSQQLDQLEYRLQQTWLHQQQNRHTALKHLRHALQQQHPVRLLEALNVRQQQLNAGLVQAIQRQLAQYQHKLGHQAQMLNSLSPLNILGRGYAICQKDNGELIYNEQQVITGDTITTRLGHGQITSQVLDTRPEQP